MNINQIYTNKDKTKQTRIVKYREGYIAFRRLKYTTDCGYNTVGNEIKYNTLNEAILKEVKWVEKDKTK